MNTLKNKNWVLCEVNANDYYGVNTYEDNEMVERMVYFEEDVKEAVLEFENILEKEILKYKEILPTLSYLEKKGMYEDICLLREIINKHKEIFGDFSDDTNKTSKENNK